MASTTEIVAYVGAAAWLPQVITWIYKAATRPTLAVLPDDRGEIGFTSYGPIFNVRLALAVDKKDVVLTKLGMKLVHENGEHRELSWRGMTETFSSIRDKSGIRQGVLEKDHPAIALKVNTTGLIVQDFKFREDRFQDHIDPVAESAVRHLEFLRSKGSSYRDEFLASEQFRDLVNTCKENFWWQAGKYRMTFVAESMHKPRLARDSFRFSLKKADADALRNNLELLDTYYECNLKLGLPGFDKQTPAFGWRYPSIDKE